MDEEEPHPAPATLVHDHRCSDAAARMRLHRHRRRQRIRCVTIELYEPVVEALVRKGWLKAEARNNPAVLVEALHGFLGYSLLGKRDV
jgi:hypothetical protein